jgi:hypothetical protein
MIIILTNRLNDLRSDDTSFLILFFVVFVFDESSSLADVLFFDFYQSIDPCGAFDDNILNLVVYSNHITVNE